MSREKFASAKYSDFVDLIELYRSHSGAIYKGRYKYDQKFYVLKEKKLSELGRAKDVMNEVKLLQQLRHVNVVQCEGWFRDIDRGTLFIVLEYCDGGDLSQLIEHKRLTKQRFSETDIWAIFYDICQGVCHLHQNGIIHRDLKALNIFYDSQYGRYKVGDLGVSRQVSDQTLLVQTFYGTPLYLSPELVENRAYNEKTDIWSLGVLLYELCALKPPFTGQTLMVLAKQVVSGEYEPLSSRSFSPILHRCLRWMLTKDYMKRPSIMQVLEYVEEKVFNNHNNINNKYYYGGRRGSGQGSDGNSADNNSVENDDDTASDTASEDSVDVARRKSSNNSNTSSNPPHHKSNHSVHSNGRDLTEGYTNVGHNNDNDKVVIQKRPSTSSSVRPSVIKSIVLKESSETHEHNRHHTSKNDLLTDGIVRDSLDNIVIDSKKININHNNSSSSGSNVQRRPKTAGPYAPSGTATNHNKVDMDAPKLSPNVVIAQSKSNNSKNSNSRFNILLPSNNSNISASSVPVSSTKAEAVAVIDPELNSPRTQTENNGRRFNYDDNKNHNSRTSRSRSRSRSKSPNRRKYKTKVVRVRSPSPHHRHHKNDHNNNNNDDNNSDNNKSNHDSDEEVLVLVSQARVLAKHRRETGRLRKLLQTRDFLYGSSGFDHVNSNNISNNGDDNNNQINSYSNNKKGNKFHRNNIVNDDHDDDDNDHNVEIVSAMDAALLKLQQQLQSVRTDIALLETALATHTLPLKHAKRLGVSVTLKQNEDVVEVEKEVTKEVVNEEVPIYLQPGPRLLLQKRRNDRNCHNNSHDNSSKGLTDGRNERSVAAGRYVELVLPTNVNNKNCNNIDKNVIPNEKDVQQMREGVLPVSPTMKHAQQELYQQQQSVFHKHAHPPDNLFNKISISGGANDNVHNGVTTSNKAHTNNKIDDKVFDSNSNNDDHFDSVAYYQQLRRPFPATDTPLHQPNVPPPPSKRELLSQRVRALQAVPLNEVDTGFLLPSMQHNAKNNNNNNNKNNHQSNNNSPRNYRPSTAKLAGNDATNNNNSNNNMIWSDKDRYYSHVRHISDVCAVLEKDPKYHKNETHVNAALHSYQHNNNKSNNSSNGGNNNSESNIRNNSNSNIEDAYDDDNPDDVGQKPRPRTAGGRRRLEKDRAAAEKLGFVSAPHINGYHAPNSNNRANENSNDILILEPKEDIDNRNSNNVSSNNERRSSASHSRRSDRQIHQKQQLGYNLITGQ